MCEDTVPYLDILAREILDNSPDTRIQFYLTWGHPHAEGCSTYHCAYYLLITIYLDSHLAHITRW